jgi:hypothetical protein
LRERSNMAQNRSDGSRQSGTAVIVSREYFLKSMNAEAQDPFRSDTGDHTPSGEIRASEW